jgi:hypothetical protein
MTPKEKAKELFDKFCYAIRTEETDSGYFTNVIYANICAILAVDEILEVIIFNKYDDKYWEEEEYWKEVKQELEKL